MFRKMSHEEVQEFWMARRNPVPVFRDQRLHFLPEPIRQSLVPFRRNEKHAFELGLTTMYGLAVVLTYVSCNKNTWQTKQFFMAVMYSFDYHSII